MAAKTRLIKTDTLDLLHPRLRNGKRRIYAEIPMRGAEPFRLCSAV